MLVVIGRSAATEQPRAQSSDVGEGKGVCRLFSNGGAATNGPNTSCVRGGVSGTLEARRLAARTFLDCADSYRLRDALGDGSHQGAERDFLEEVLLLLLGLSTSRCSRHVETSSLNDET